MIYKDRVYGQYKITDPVILELLNSPTLQRLKGVDQAGYRPLWIKPDTKLGRYDNTRYAHSMGVYLLLKRYGASLPEQIAGLVHDVSHSAFSHCIDYVLAAGSPTENSHQDNLFGAYVRRSDIPAILEKYGFDPEFILDDKNFPLKENQLPDLCADRIDYALRMGVIFGEINVAARDGLLRNLAVSDGRWVFRNQAFAQRFAKLFLRLNVVYLSGFKSAVMYLAVGDCLKYALQKNYISEADLYTTDRQVLDKVKRNVIRDPRLKLFWVRMNNKAKALNGGAAAVYCKSRIVDPLFSQNGKIKRLSQANPKWTKVVERELKPKQYFVMFKDSPIPVRKTC